MSSLLEKLKKIPVVRPGPVVLKHAGPSDRYIDIKAAYGDPLLRAEIARALWTLMPYKTTCVACSGHGGIPLAADLSRHMELKMTIVRGEPKPHGLNKMIDGYIPTDNDQVAIVDDVCTTGESLRKMIEILTPTEATIRGCYVVVKRGEPNMTVPFHYLFKEDDFL